MELQMLWLFSGRLTLAGNGRVLAKWRIKKDKDEYSTEDNRSTQVEVWQSAAIAAMQC